MKFSVKLLLFGLMLSFLFHEVGHWIAFASLGIQSYIGITIYDGIPTLCTHGAVMPHYIYAKCFVVLAGPIFSAILLLAAKIREWVLLGIMQVLYIPIEFLTSLLSITGHYLYIMTIWYFFLMVLVSNIYMSIMLRKQLS